MSAEERSEIHANPLDALDDVWLDLGLQGHAGKKQDLVLDSKVLGVNLRDGTRLLSRGKRLWMLFEYVADLAAVGQASPHGLDSQWTYPVVELAQPPNVFVP